MLTLLGLILFGCTHQRVAREDSLVESRGRTPALSASAFKITEPTPEDLSLKELREILRQNQFSTIDSVLAHLAKIKPSYMSTYTLAFDSRSLHTSSKTKPRAIVYGNSGNFIVTFNADENDDQYFMLEVTEFNHSTKRFEYREIEFSEGRPNKDPFTISEVGGPKLFPQDREGKCLACHTNSRPIWEAYDLWPGFFGGDDDAQFTDYAKRGANSIFNVPFPSSAKTELANFLKARSKLARYKHLNELQSSRLISPLYTSPQQANASSGYNPRPNADLTILLFQLNAQRIAREVSDHPQALKYRDLLIYSLGCTYDRGAEVIATDPRYRANNSFKQLLTEFRRHADPLILNHSVYKLEQIRKDLGITPQAIIKTWVEYYPTEQKLRGSDGAAQPSGIQVIESLLGSGALAQTKVTRTIGSFLATVRKFLPGINVDLWPTALYEGVHIYSDGYSNSSRSLIQALNHELYATGDLDQMGDWSELGESGTKSEVYCKQLVERLPNDFR